MSLVLVVAPAGLGRVLGLGVAWQEEEQGVLPQGAQALAQAVVPVYPQVEVVWHLCLLLCLLCHHCHCHCRCRCCRHCRR